MMIEWFVNVWGPALAIIGIWFLLMRQMMKGTVAQRAQVAEMQRQNDLLERIATALEQRKA